MRCVVCNRGTTRRILVYRPRTGEPWLLPACEGDCIVTAQERGHETQEAALADTGAVS